MTNIAARLGNHIIGRPFWSVDRIVLPVGISFYTFQVISYTADVYKGLVRPVRNILDFGFYVSFFPQLVAGPIIKASDFIPQLYRRYALSRTQFGIAVFWILNGLTKKIVMSDYLAVNFIDRGKSRFSSGSTTAVLNGSKSAMDCFQLKRIWLANCVCPTPDETEYRLT